MMKKVFITEKPSVAIEFAKVLNDKTKKYDGYLESENYIITWCVGHLITLSYPHVYDPKLKQWSFNYLPFIPKAFKYELIDNVRKQFYIVKGILNREDINTIYICTDSGREGEYIYRLVDAMARVSDKKRLRVWIDSQTEEEIKKGIKNAKDWSEYNNLANSAYLRAIEDYLTGINFSRAMTLTYGNYLSKILNRDNVVISVGRVMSCTLGMIVKREREIRKFNKLPYYRVLADISLKDSEDTINAEFKAVEGSCYFESPLLYKDNGFLDKEKANIFLNNLLNSKQEAILNDINKKKENKNPPLLYNLSELQNECSKKFKISPDDTLKIVQKLYEAKLVTYPRTDARVLSKAVAKEILNNIQGLSKIKMFESITKYIIDNKKYEGLSKTKYVNDKKITDHYAIIPTGYIPKNNLDNLSYSIFILICKRFLSIFLPPAKFTNIKLDFVINKEHFFSNYKVCDNEGYLFLYKKDDTKDENKAEKSENIINSELINQLKKNKVFGIKDIYLKDGETSPPKRFNSGSIILAMENAGNYIEDEELREQIKNSGIGTSATRAEILKKLVKIGYISLNNKTQIISPTFLGELIYDALDNTLPELLNPEITAKWESGLSDICDGKLSTDEYMYSLREYIYNGVQKAKYKSKNNLYLDSVDELNKIYTDMGEKNET